MTGNASGISGGVPTLGAPGGHIHLASVASAGEVRVDPASQASLDAFEHLGQITIAAAALLSVSGDEAGTVVIRGGRLLLDHAVVLAETRGNVNGAGLGIDIAVTGEAVITNGAAIVTSALGAGRGGDIRITADSVDVSNVSVMSTRAFPGSTGDGGNVTITAASVQVRDGALLSTVTAGMGQGGDVALEVGTLRLVGGGQIFSGTLGSGSGGDLTINARDTVTIAGRDLSETQSLLSTTTTGGSGAAGRITLTAPTVELNDGGIQTYTNDIGRGGDVLIQAGRLTLLNNAKVHSFSLGAGAGGMITLRATEEVLESSGIIALTTGGTGRAGDIAITAGRLTLTNSSIEAKTDRGGDAGTVTITASSLVLDGGLIQSSTIDDRPAGDVVVNVGRLTLTRESRLLSTSGTVDSAGNVIAGTGASGAINISAAEAVSLVEGSVISTSTGGGPGGHVSIATPRLIVDGSTIQAATLGNSRAGDIVVQAQHVTLTGGAEIGSDSGLPNLTGGLIVGTGSAGNVTIAAATVELKDGVIRTATAGNGHAGNIVIEAERLTLTNSARLLSVSGLFDTAGRLFVGTGAAGTVTVLATDTVLLTEGSVISTQTSGGEGGRVSITAPNLRIDGAGITASTFGDEPAGDIVVSVGSMALLDGAQLLSTSGFVGPDGSVVRATGAAGTITVSATDTVVISGVSSRQFPSGIFVITVDGPGGRVSIIAPNIIIQGGLIQASTAGNGAAGNIVVEAGRLTLTEGALLVSTSGVAGPTGTVIAGTGASGNVTVSATEIVSFANASGILVTTAGGQGGQIAITTPTLTLDGGSEIVASTSGDSRAGDIVVDVGRLVLAGGGLFSTSGVLDPAGHLRVGSGAAGNVTVSATESISLSNTSSISVTTAGGQGGQIAIVTPTLTLAGGSEIIANTAGGSRGGDIIVNVGHLSITEGAGFFSTSGALDPLGNVIVGKGAAGTVTISASVIDIDRGIIQTSASGDGRAGDIAINAERLTLTGGAQILSQSGIMGPTGNILVGQGAAGTITISATSMDVNQGSIQTSTSGDGHAGDVIVNVARLTLMGEGGIFSASGMLDGIGQIRIGTGAAGNVTVFATEAVSIAHPSVISTATLGGAGGTVSITTPRLYMDGGLISAETGGDARAGDIVIEAANITLTKEARISSTSGTLDPMGNLWIGTGKAGSVTVRAADSLAISDFGSIFSDTLGRGDAGTVTVFASTLHMENESLIEARTIGDGNAGDVQVTVGRLTLSGGAQIGSSSGIATAEGDLIVGTGSGGRVMVTATDEVHITGRNSTGVVASGIFSETGGAGHAGLVSVSTPRLIMDGGRISTNTGGDGHAGDILVQVGSASLTGGAQITSASGIDVGGRFFVGTGAGGNVRLTATDTVQITGQNSGLATNTAGQGRGGDIVLQARQVQLMEGASLTAAGTATGAAGSILLTVEETIESAHSTVTTTAHDGKGGVITLTAGTAITLMATDIAATVTGGSQPGGSITLTTPRLTITGSRLAAETQGAGKAGDIALAVDTLVAQEAILTSSSTGAATGAAGSVTVHGLDGAATTARFIGSTLQTSAEGMGAGGAITVTVSDTLEITATTISATVHDGVDTPDTPHGDITLQAPHLMLLEAQLEAETTGTRQAGDITLQVGGLSAQDARLTSSSTQGATGNAGTITVQGLTTTTPRAQTVQLTRSVFATEADVADGGDIFILAEGRVRLEDSAITTAVHSGVGQGGNILIDPEFVILDRSQVLADAFGGPGGNIRIVAEGFLADATSRVSASSAQNVAGTITIEGFTNLSGLVVPVTPDFASALALLRDQCAARLHEGSLSTLVERGRDGVPASPDDLLPSRFLPTDAGGTQPAGTGSLPRDRQEDLQGDTNRPLQSRDWPLAAQTVSFRPSDCPPR